MCLVLLLVLGFSLSTCVGKKKVSVVKPNDHVQELEKENGQLKLRVEQLEQELLVKQDEVKKLILSQQRSTREVVRSKAKLRSHSSKAETVANIAEVKTMLTKARGETMTGQLQQVILETEGTIAKSVLALNRGDVDTAFALSNTAQQLIQPIYTQQGNNSFSEGADVVFVDPLLMKVTRTCNVRNGPGMQNEVVFFLESGMEIQALAYMKNWIQIESDKKGKGWVYYRLLEIVP
jgi:cell division protein FtsB